MAAAAGEAPAPPKEEEPAPPEGEEAQLDLDGMITNGMNEAIYEESVKMPKFKGEDTVLSIDGTHTYTFVKQQLFGVDDGKPIPGSRLHCGFLADIIDIIYSVVPKGGKEIEKVLIPYFNYLLLVIIPSSDSRHDFPFKPLGEPLFTYCEGLFLEKYPIIGEVVKKFFERSIPSHAKFKKFYNDTTMIKGILKDIADEFRNNVKNFILFTHQQKLFTYQQKSPAGGAAAAPIAVLPAGEAAAPLPVPLTMVATAQKIQTMILNSKSTSFFVTKPRGGWTDGRVEAELKKIYETLGEADELLIDTHPGSMLPVIGKKSDGSDIPLAQLQQVGLIDAAPRKVEDGMLMVPLHDMQDIVADFCIAYVQPNIIRVSKMKGLVEKFPQNIKLALQVQYLLLIYAKKFQF